MSNHLKLEGNRATNRDYAQDGPTTVNVHSQKVFSLAKAQAFGTHPHLFPSSRRSKASSVVSSFLTFPEAFSSGKASD